MVCAGAKSILDIGRTLEYLETQGVTVASYGETKDFPAFFSRKSGFEAPYSVNNPVDAAKLIGKHYYYAFLVSCTVCRNFPRGEGQLRSLQGAQLSGSSQTVQDFKEGKCPLPTPPF